METRSPLNPRQAPPFGAWRALAAEIAGRPVTGIAMVDVLSVMVPDEFAVWDCAWTYEGEAAGASVFVRRVAGYPDVTRRVVVR